MESWDFFDLLLEEANIVGTPGSGFGPSGEGYLRLTAFNTLENTKEAMSRISKLSFQILVLMFGYQFFSFHFIFYNFIIIVYL